MAIVSSVLLWFMPSDYHFGIFCPLYRLSYFDLCLLIVPLVSFGHCIVCPTSMYAFWLPIWYLLAIVSSVLLWFVPSDYPFGIFCPLYRLSYFDLRLLITPLVSIGKLYRLSYFDLCFLINPFGIFWPLYRLSYFDLCLLITHLVSFRHCIVCPTSIYAFWLPLWYLLAIATSVLLWFMPSDYPFGIFWQIVSSVFLRLMPSDYPFAICWPLYRVPYFDKCLLITPLVSFGHCIFCPTSINALWLSLKYMLAIVSSLLLR